MNSFKSNHNQKFLPMNYYHNDLKHRIEPENIPGDYLYINNCDDQLKTIINDNQTINYAGNGCSILFSTAEFLSQQLENKSPTEIKEFLSLFQEFLNSNEEEFNPKYPQQFETFLILHHHKSRLKCANLAISSLIKALN